MDVIHANSGIDRFVPRDFLAMIGNGQVGEVQLGDHVERRVTLLFSDIRNFTQLSESLPPQQVFDLLNGYLGEMIPILQQHRGIIDKFIGDAIMALFGFSADHAVTAAIEMLQRLEEGNRQRLLRNEASIHIGIGLNTGIAMLGTVGDATRMETTVIGDTVNLAARIESLTKRYHTPLLISEDTLLSLEDPDRYALRFVDRVRVKGKLHPTTVYELFDHETAETVAAKRETIALFEKGVAYYHLKEIDRAIPLFDACLDQTINDTVAKVYRERCSRYRKDGTHEGTGELDRHMSWHASYSIDQPEIDQQHQRLFQEVNKLSMMIRDQRFGGLSGLLDFLSDYAQEHFHTEESLMERHGYPFIREHQREHRNFVLQFRKVRTEIESGQHDKLYLLFRINLFLVDWLVNHTTGVDKHLGHFLAGQGVEHV